MAERFNPGDFAYAHRGLWTAGGLTENSLQAFLQAAERGLGIEFDVRPSSDGIPIIFHDPDLGRMTRESGPTEARSAKELVGLELIGGGEIIALERLLDAWPAKTPLLCEMKVDGQTDPVAFCQSVAALLSQHSGPAALMSFSTEAVATIPEHIMRGQLIAPSKGNTQKSLAETPTVPVDYLACHTSDAKDASLQAARSDLPLITWTVKDAATCEDLSAFTDSQIFEGFDPALAKRHISNT
ncbi:MAG: glycerophosphodiester phosphodiesterase family protein [Pseudomonadota bacterium]